MTGGVFGLLLLTWLTLHWLILPHIERWRPTIETQASRALGIPLRIGAIEVRSSGWVPTVELRDVSLLDAQQRPALVLQRVVASVSARSLLDTVGSLKLRLAQLLIDGARLEVRRDAAGRLFVAGFEFSGPGDDSETGAADWLFRQREVAVLNASLHWTDELRGAPPLALSAVDLVLRNSLRRHELRLDATPPPAWGERFTLRGKFTQSLLDRSGDWQRWSGQAYADAPRADASQWRRYIELPFELTQGVGAARAWVDVQQGAVKAVTLDLALRAVALRLGATLEPLQVEQVQGRLQGQRMADGDSVALRQFSFQTHDGLRWPAGDLTFAWTRGADGALVGGEFSAGRLDLALLAQTAARLPLAAAVRTLLAETNPQGIASDIQARWRGPFDALASYRVQARLSGLALDAKPTEGIGRPGLRNATVDFDASETGGEATLAFKAGAIDLPGVFAEPMLPLDDASAKLSWRIAPRAGAEPALQVQVTDARIANADAQAAFNATWKTGAGPGRARGGRFPGTLDLTGTLGRGVAARTARYLPLGLSERTRLYVQRALLGGSFTRASFRLKGDLWDAPFFAASPGEFKLTLVADDVSFAYAPSAPAPNAPSGAAAYASPWPPLTRLTGEVVLDRASLAFQNAQGRIFGVDLTALRGGIPDLAGKPVLSIEANAKGPVADMLRFVNTTPVGDATHGTLREAAVTGDGDLRVALTLPLYDLSQTKVDAALQLAGNDLRLRRDLPLFEAARGRADFSGKGVTIAGASARVLGGEVVIDGGTQPDGSLRFNAQGSAAAEALRRTPELGPVARLAGAVSGQARYKLALGLGRGVPEIDLTSDLVGLALNLPPPLNKAADAALPLRYQTALAAAAPGVLHDTLRVELGTVVQALYRRDVTADVPRVLGGGIGVFEPAPTPASGVAALATLDSLNLDAWEAASARLLSPGGAAGMAGPPSGADAGYLPTQIGLKAQRLTLGGRTLTRVAAGLSQQDGQWRANLDADQLDGYVEYRPPGAAAGNEGGRVYARLARLNLPQSDADGVADLLEQQPRSVPALDVVIDDLELRGRRLGRLEVLAVNRPPPASEWSLTRFNLRVPEASLSASGRWGGAGAGAGSAQSTLRFELDVADSGALLARFGTPGAVRSGKGSLKGQLGWQGPPLAPHLPSLKGRFDVAIESGQFLQVNSGAARLLGVLSMQSLARRLTGDFRDLFQEGFAFDSITGEVAVADGVASTDSLLMRSAHAVVAIQGSADIVHETQDLRVVVVPEINLGAASLAYAVINPVVGLGTFLAQLFLREPLAQAGTRAFHVSGRWADPQVEPVAYTPAKTPAPPAAAASAASSVSP